MKPKLKGDTAMAGRPLDKDELIRKLYEALEAAQRHLNYCGYGDSWERECAQESGLEQQIEDALASVPDELKE